MHELESDWSVTGRQGRCDLSICLRECLIPHRYHRIRRRSNDEINGLVGDWVHVSKRLEMDHVIGLHAGTLSEIGSCRNRDSGKR